MILTIADCWNVFKDTPFLYTYHSITKISKEEDEAVFMQILGPITKIDPDLLYDTGESVYELVVSSLKNWEKYDLYPVQVLGDTQLTIIDYFESNAYLPTSKCICDLYTVLLPKGCQCGGT